MAIISTKCQFKDCNNLRDIKRRSSLCAMHRTRKSRGMLTDEENKFYEAIKRDTKATGKICCVTNCKTQVYHHGNVCSKHRWRIKKYGQYDLPKHQGQPNTLKLPTLPEGIVVECKKHGYLKKEETYPRFYKGKENSHYCKICVIDLNRKNKYGLTNGELEYEQLLTTQNGRCAICKTDKNNTTRSGKIKKFNIDHCHKTNKVRALLCSFCNSLLGYVKDSIEILESAINYLKKHQK
jgi:hypothetical protein